MKNQEIINVDIAVIGGGTSGIFLTLYLVEKGFKVVLIEKTQRIGGALVNNLVYPTAGFHTPNFKYVYSPLVDNFLKELSAKKLTLGHIKDPLNFSSTVTPISPTAYKILINKLFNHTNFYFFPLSIIKNIKHSNNRVRSIIFNSYSKTYNVVAKFFVDASGVLLTSNFIPMEYNFDIQNIQAVSLIFKISNVNFSSILKDVKTNPQEFYYKTDPDFMNKQKFLSISGYYSLAKEYLNNPSLLLTRDRFLFFSYIDRDSVVVNTTRLFLKDIVKNHEIEIESIEKNGYKILLEQAIYIHKIMKNNIEGFKNSYISEIADFIGIRHYRNIKGEYILSLEDVTKGKFFDDNVSIGTWPIDIHISNSIIEKPINENGYGIPFRSCINNYKNLVFIGKNISADKYAFSSSRIQATLMILGENVGRILEYCLNKNTNPTELDYRDIKKSTHLKIK
ncbi:MAG: FAD-dependent oxidoreductase [bacterium]|nr:FAD-dependent oxidoreductase [bacterium]